jgi:glycosyltransferase involved in cell wall biosynthesis
MADVIVLIPAYEPDQKLVNLVSSMRETDPALRILIIDDGSGPDYTSVFDATESLGCTVLRHTPNRGKGFALKAGFAHVMAHHPDEDVVCADCDGQHRLDDILTVATQVANSPRVMVLGSRSFTGAVPFRSRFGNSVTRTLFLLATGKNLRDTQTGLRGYPAAMLSWLQKIPGDRFEYELNLLLEAGPAGYGIEEVHIETVYLADNASSHFRPVIDSARVYLPLAKFSMSSLGAFVVDASALFLFMALTDNLLFSVVTARIISSTVNYIANRRLVFAQGRETSKRRSGLRYGTLVLVILTANYSLMHLLTKDIGVHLFPAKILTEAFLFTASYHLQRRFVFATSHVIRSVRRRRSHHPITR